MTSNAYTITPTPAIAAYGSHQFFVLQIDRANTGAATINVNGLGAIALQKLNRSSVPEALAAGDLQPGMSIPAWYDGTRFTLMLPGKAITATGSNGRYWRHPDGTLLCWGNIALSYFSTIAVAYTWTFPLAFVSTPNVSVTMPFGAGNYSGVARDVFPQINPSTTTAEVYALAATGAAALSGGAQILNVRVFAIGRWF
jgi:hypothetical protein